MAPFPAMRLTSMCVRNVVPRRRWRPPSWKMCLRICRSVVPIQSGSTGPGLKFWESRYKKPSPNLALLDAKSKQSNAKRARPHDCCTQHKSAGAILSSEVNPTTLQGQWTTSTFHFKHVQTSHSCNPLMAFRKLNGKLRKLLTPATIASELHRSPVAVAFATARNTLSSRLHCVPCNSDQQIERFNKEMPTKAITSLAKPSFRLPIPTQLCSRLYNLSRIRSRFFPGILDSQWHMLTWTRFAHK